MELDFSWLSGHCRIAPGDHSLITGRKVRGMETCLGHNLGQRHGAAPFTWSRKDTRTTPGLPGGAVLRSVTSLAVDTEGLGSRKQRICARSPPRCW
eukprot:4579782-Amphidinium_carterae.2